MVTLASFELRLRKCVCVVVFVCEGTGCTIKGVIYIKSAFKAKIQINLGAVGGKSIKIKQQKILVHPLLST